MTIVIKNFSGEVIVPSDKNYEQASKVYAAKGNPIVILRPKNSKDVAAAVSYARENSLVISVRSGGHSGLGFSTNNGGVVIDLSLMKRVEILDENERLISVEGGAVWEEIANALKPYNFAISSGDTKSVGVGGLTLGGGVGLLVRKHGLALDNLVAAEVVTADGKILRASEKENPDLFWAIRGGGGNFGVVTKFEFKAHVLKGVYAGTIQFSLENLEKVLTGWRDYMRSAPDEITTSFIIMPSFGPEMPAGIMLMCYYAGDDEETGKKILDPLLHLDTVKSHDLGKKEYISILGEAHPPADMKSIAQNIMVRDFSDELVEKIVDICGDSPKQVFLMRSLGGVMNQVPVDATAFPYRDCETLIVCGMFVPLTATKEDEAKAIEPWKKVAAYGDGSYVNFLTTATEADLAAIYPKSTYEKLSRVKKKYDPQNIFRLNHNIKPS